MELDYMWFTHSAHAWTESPEAKNEFEIRDALAWIKLTQDQCACVDLEDWERVRPFRWFAWMPRGCKSFYARSSEGLYLHRFILSADYRVEVDHRNLNGLDNRKNENLRIATSSLNKANRSIRPDNKSGYKGVGFKKSHNLWRARIRRNGVEETLGYFTDPKTAGQAYDQRAKELFGEFARLNFT